ncbi:hypothetical protein ULMS_01910 [Patiriisocius marinistellae]|uniref:Uncharacterized protein n=1 Tax=Patiriisocius marinistellae TaxID=2494560 RepID=A0A5J4FT68_9FLAO|nr:hypothetical protein ULMS_01910 [Patiriisocius marinistellae]
MGITTADKAKPKVTNNQSLPALNPKKGGKIKFPAPKKRENNANAITKVCFLIFKFGSFA